MNYSRLREQARHALDGNWGSAIIACLIATFLGATESSGVVSFNVSNSSNNNGGGGTSNNPQLDGMIDQIEDFFTHYGELILSILGIAMIVGFVFTFVMFCVGCIVKVGYNRFNLDLIDGITPRIGSLFSFFGHWKNIILTSIRVSVYVTLWSLLCFIPGIIAAYKYAMVPYILAEDPTTPPSEALERSKEIMDGYKWHYFVLHLTFIGWTLLCVLSCGIGFIWLNPYINASAAAFYREISNYSTPVHDDAYSYFSNGKNDRDEFPRNNDMFTQQRL